jgi:hypothetical protein
VIESSADLALMMIGFKRPEMDNTVGQAIALKAWKIWDRQNSPCGGARMCALFSKKASIIHHGLGACQRIQTHARRRQVIPHLQELASKQLLLGSGCGPYRFFNLKTVALEIPKYLAKINCRHAKSLFVN